MLQREYISIIITSICMLYFTSKLTLSLEWGSCKVELTRYSQVDYSSSEHRKPVVKKFELDHQFGSCFKEKFTQLLTWTRNDRVSFLK